MSPLNLSGKKKAGALDLSQKTGCQGEQGLFAFQPSPAWAQPLISRSRDEEAAFHGDYSVMPPEYLSALIGCHSIALPLSPVHTVVLQVAKLRPYCCFSASGL